MVMTEQQLATFAAAIPALDEAAMQQAAERWNFLTKPLGSLGQLELVGQRLAGLQGTIYPSVDRKAVVVMCGDHGVTAEGVSAFPQEVTGLMIDNFVRGGAAVNVLARQMQADVLVVDIGAKGAVKREGVLLRNVKQGTDNMAQGPAMTRDEALAALNVGIEIATELAVSGVQVIALGEMGIGNTTPSAALAAVLTGHPLAELVGRGTGIESAQVAHKRAVIERALTVNQPNPQDGLDVLAKVGGLEIAGLAGVVIGAARAGVAVLIDGVIATAAALVAVRIAPRAHTCLFASHLSEEPAHAVMLAALELQPLLHLNMRLGEGTGAVLAMPLLDASTRIVREMATFADLGLA